METSRYEIKFGVEKEERLDIADDSPKQHGLTEEYALGGRGLGGAKILLKIDGPNNYCKVASRSY